VRLRIRFKIFSNELPNLRDAAMANVARYLIIQATRVIPPEDRDPDLATKIVASELPAILNLALEGRKRLYARGRFIQPASAMNLIETSEEIASPHKAFIDDYYELDPTKHEKKLDVFECWKEWAEIRNLQVGTESQLTRNLQAAFSGKIKPTRLRDEKHRIQAYQGIKRKKIDPYRRFCETRLIEEANGETPDGKDELIPLLKSDSEESPS
jgi:putative DNA primase/helicase